MAGLEVAARLAEVLELRSVDVRVELGVDAPEPPRLRQAERKVAPALARPPRADPAALREEAHEARQPVVPVVVAGNRVEVRNLVGRQVGQGRPVGPGESLRVPLPARPRIDLIAAEDEQPAAPRGVLSELERLPPEEPRHRVRRIEPLADIGRVVEPERAVLVAVMPVRYGDAGGSS